MPRAVRTRGPRRLPAIPGARHPRRRCPRRQPAAGAGAALGLAGCGPSRTSSTPRTTRCSSSVSRSTGSTWIVLAGPGIVVRRAGEGERLTTLDDVERALSDEDLLICDLEKPVAIARRDGRGASEVSDETTDILLESAYFTRTGVLRTARRLDLHSEASHRFERGSDPEGLERAATRCAKLIVDWAGGTVARGVAGDGEPPTRRWVSMRPARAYDAARRRRHGERRAPGLRPARGCASLAATTTRSRSRCPATASTSSARST